MTSQSSSPFRGRPATRLGWWAVGLAAGVVGLMVLIRKHECLWLVWLAILPGAFVLFLLLGEFLVPH